MTRRPGAGPSAVRVLVADPAPVFRAGVSAAVADAPDLVVVGEAGDPAEVRESVATLTPAVVVLDAWLGGLGMTTCAALADAYPGLGLLVVANPAAAVDVTAVAAAGATGYVAREATLEQLVESIRATAQGRTVLSPEAATQAMGELAGLARRRGATAATVARPAAHLSARELEVLQLVAQGLGNRAIAEQLFISENTVKNHVRSVHEKLQVHSRTQAVMRAVRDGLLRIG